MLSLLAPELQRTRPQPRRLHRRQATRRTRPGWFTEKHADGTTALYPLVDFNPRRDENVSRRYLQGMYGALPIVNDAEFAAVLENLAPQESGANA